MYNTVFIIFYFTLNEKRMKYSSCHCFVLVMIISKANNSNWMFQRVKRNLLARDCSDNCNIWKLILNSIVFWHWNMRPPFDIWSKRAFTCHKFREFVVFTTNCNYAILSPYFMLKISFISLHCLLTFILAWIQYFTVPCYIIWKDCQIQLVH